MFNTIYLPLVEEETALVYYTFILFFTENSSIKKDKLIKFLTGSCRIPVLRAPPSIEVNFKYDCVNGCTCFPTVLIFLLHQSYQSVLRMKRKSYLCFQQHYIQTLALDGANCSIKLNLC